MFSSTLALSAVLTYACTDLPAWPPVKYFYIDKTGNKVLDGIGFYGDSFKEGLALTCDEYHDDGEIKPFRYIDRTGKTKFTISAYKARPFSEGVAAIQAKVPEINGGCPGYINKEGKWAIPPRFYGYGDSFSDGLALESTPDWKLQYIDHSGSQRIDAFEQFKSYNKPKPPWIENLRPFSDGLAMVRIGDYTDPRDKTADPCQFGYINKDGEWNIKLKELWGTAFYEGLAKRSSPGASESIFTDTSGKEVLRLPYYARNFSEGLCAIADHGRYGYCDRSGRIVIKPQYENAQEFSEGLAAVIIDGKAGYLDSKGTMVISPQFAYAGDFSEGLAVVVPFDKHHLKPRLTLWGQPSGKYFARERTKWIEEEPRSD